jgi:multidrug efflux pump subunit AcrA (membrane-fusion protein)
MPRKKRKNNYSHLQNISYKYKGKLNSLVKRVYFKNKVKSINRFIAKKPFISFFAVLFSLFALIIIGNVIFSPGDVKETVPIPKNVEIYKLGSAPKLKFQGQIEKSGVIKIVAISPGVISSISTWEGQKVYKGSNLINLVSNYQGGNIFSLSRQIAESQYNLAKDTFDTQNEIIGKQKEIASKTNENSEELRSISSKSAEDTQSLLDLNNSLISQIDANLSNYSATNSGGINDTVIFQTKQVKSQLQSAVTQLNAQLRNLQYQSDEEKPPTELANLQKEITLKQLEIQEKSLALNIEISKLQYNLALVNEATLHPVAPFAGVVDRIYVKEGQFVTPGTSLVSLSGNAQHVKIVAKIPFKTAKNISMIEESIITINGNKIKMFPSYVSSDATDGQLYSVIYQIDDIYKDIVTDGAFVTVDIPIGTGDTNNSVPFIPLDSVFQTQEEAYVFIIDKNSSATVNRIVLGNVQGRFVEIISGLPANSTVILSRNVVEGDKVKISK